MEPVPYHAGVQVFQALHLRELLRRRHGAPSGLLLSQLHVRGLGHSEGPAPPGEVLGLGSQHSANEPWMRDRRVAGLPRTVPNGERG